MVGGKVKEISSNPGRSGRNTKKCELYTSTSNNNIETDTQIQLSYATLTRSNMVVLENDLTLNYEVGEEIQGGITLPDFKFWMDELCDGQHQDDIQAELHYGQGDGGREEGAVRKAV